MKKHEKIVCMSLLGLILAGYVYAGSANKLNALLPVFTCTSTDGKSGMAFYTILEAGKAGKKEGYSIISQKGVDILGLAADFMQNEEKNIVVRVYGIDEGVKSLTLHSDKKTLTSTSEGDPATMNCEYGAYYGQEFP